jgi:uncharacterized Tic20 family protein
MSEVSQDDKNMGMIAHLSGLVSIGPLIIWLMNKDNPDKSFVTNNAKEALNFVITLWLIMIPVAIVSSILAFIPVLGWIAGILIWLCMMVVGLGALVFLIMAAMKAKEGVEYVYPYSLRLVK